MHTVVFGGKGQLGRDLMLLLEGTEAHGFDLPELDIADSDAVSSIVEDLKPDAVINAAAYTNVEAAEDDEALAFRVNEAGARNVAQAAADAGLPVVYFSTDYVFGGAKTTPYEVEDEIAPIGVYARSKAAGEAATREANPRHFIVRTAWLYGPGGNCFPEKIIQAATARPELKVVDDEIGSPTHTYDLAEATLALVKTEAYGAYHGVNAGSCSRYEFAKRILELAGIATPITPCSSTEFVTKAERPQYSVLCTKTFQAAAYPFRSWQDALRHYMTRRGPQQA